MSDENSIAMTRESAIKRIVENKATQKFIEALRDSVIQDRNEYVGLFDSAIEFDTYSNLDAYEFVMRIVALSDKQVIDIAITVAPFH